MRPEHIKVVLGASDVPQAIKHAQHVLQIARVHLESSGVGVSVLWEGIVLSSVVTERLNVFIAIVAL